ncbi:hypothetical protein FJTKL_11439 [Diaporthe vaccinii]|uniref:Uncharacterized protein n=1 Tax=Diaporthe vaccinii TaxID=105482 RepID=A0ABR4EH36_9PEZI
MRCAVILSLAALAVAAPLSQGLEARQDDISSILAALQAESPEDAAAAQGALNAPAPAPVARSPKKEAAAAADDDEEQLDADGYELDTRQADDEQLDADGYELDTRKANDDEEQLDADGYELDTRKVNDDEEQLDAEGYELDTRKTEDADEEKEEEEEVAAGEEDA